MAKSAIQTDVADVMLVTEGGNLRDRGIDGRRLGDDRAPEQDASNAGNQNYTRAELQRENLLGSKDLRHDA